MAPVAVLVGLSLAALAFAQKPAFDFDPEYRTEFTRRARAGNLRIKPEPRGCRRCSCSEMSQGDRSHAPHVAVRDSEYEFGMERFDLILFTWTMPLVDIRKVLNALKPGGIVVMECGADFVGTNGMLKLFDPLRIEHYEIVRAKSDFYDRRETDVLRMIARKPGMP